MTQTLAVPRAMTKAGSDSGAGAGIQADLKTFAAMGVYGTAVITVVTAQNTLGVTAIKELPLYIIAAQIEAIISDIGTDTVKTGMLSSPAIIKLVSREIRRLGLTQLIVDPVMVSKRGDRLLHKDSVEYLKKDLIPLATVVTPNIPEAEVLTGMTIRTPKDAREAAKAILSLGAKNIVVKGGHLAGDAVDTFYDGHEFSELRSARIDTKNTHGTGCTFASAIAASLAKGTPMLEAVSQAKTYVTEAIRLSYQIGHGHGPLNHFYALPPQGMRHTT